MNTDPAVHIAKEKLAELEAEAEEIRTFLRVHERLSRVVPPPNPEAAIAARPRAPSVADANLAVVAHTPVVAAQLPAPMPLPFSTSEEVIQAARLVLRENGPVPMHIDNLYALVLQKGVRIGGNNPKGNLSAKLSPPDDIRYVQGQGWVCTSTQNGPPLGVAQMPGALQRPQ